MREPIGHHVAARHALQAVVADRRRGLKALFDVAGFQLDLALRGAHGLRGGVAPDANAYMEIFNANRDQLSDPDKIKPGQVLDIPQTARK